MDDMVNGDQYENGKLLSDPINDMKRAYRQPTFVPIDAGDKTVARDAGKAGFETVEPRYNGACQVSWTPGKVEG